jgi:hypothetical protein
MYGCIMTALHLLIYVDAGLYRWYPWDFQEDKIEIKYVEAFNCHLGDCGLWKGDSTFMEKTI